MVGGGVVVVVVVVVVGAEVVVVGVAVVVAASAVAVVGVSSEAGVVRCGAEVVLGAEAGGEVVEVLVVGATGAVEDELSESLPQLAASSARGISRLRAREVRGGGGV